MTLKRFYVDREIKGVERAELMARGLDYGLKVVVYSREGRSEVVMEGWKEDMRRFKEYTKRRIKTKHRPKGFEYSFGILS
jgi:acylphosphatase